MKKDMYRFDDLIYELTETNQCVKRANKELGTIEGLVIAPKGEATIFVNSIEDIAKWNNCIPKVKTIDANKYACHLNIKGIDIVCRCSENKRAECKTFKKIQKVEQNSRKN